MKMCTYLCAPILLALLAILYLTTTSSAANIRTAEKKPWELSEVLRTGVGARGFNGTWITDKEFYYTANNGIIRKYNAATNTNSDYISSSILNLYKDGTFELSPDNKLILVRYAKEAGFRHSYVAKYDIYDTVTKTATPVYGGKKLQYCSWSPEKNYLAFVYQNNVYIRIADVETPMTDDGIPGVIYNGVPDWVYEEEVLSTNKALWWSPDGAKLIVGFFNDTEVQTYKYFLYGQDLDLDYQYPKEVDLRYPKVGTPNPKVLLKIFDFSKFETSRTKLTAPEHIVSAEHIMQNVAWVNSSTYLVTWLNRRQNVASIQACGVDGNCREVKRLEEPDGWVSLECPKCTKKGTNCLFAYWIGNWYQVWNLDLATGENIWKARGEFTVKKLYGYDEENDKLYYQASLPGKPADYHVFSNNDCLSCNLRDADGAYCSFASASFSKSYSYYTLYCSGPGPGYTKIFASKDHSEVFNWEDNAAFRRSIAGKLLPIIKYVNVTLADGTTGYAKLKLPPYLDESKKYPMILKVYGGPQSVGVTSDFLLAYDAYVTTNLNIIYAQVDVRGTANLGKRNMFAVNNNLGVLEVEDQIYVTQELQQLYPYIDKERTAVWGWSYGGYMTGRILAADKNKVYQCGVSVAPVTSWIYYDTVYTERYMGLLTDKNNHYGSSSVFAHLENFRKHDYLLIHGSGDDNVHYQQSLLLAKALQTQDIMFEQMIYTDEAHGISNFLLHVYHTINNFWSRCLKL